MISNFNFKFKAMSIKSLPVYQFVCYYWTWGKWNNFLAITDWYKWFDKWAISQSFLLSVNLDYPLWFFLKIIVKKHGVNSNILAESFFRTLTEATIEDLQIAKWINFRINATKFKSKYHRNEGYYHPRNHLYQSVIAKKYFHLS